LLNFFLIHYYQALGAATATVLTQFFVVIGQMILTKRLFQLRGGSGWMIRLFLFAVLTFAVAWFFQQYLKPEYWWAAMLVSSVLSGLIALALGFLRDSKQFLVKN
jgi:peptidoglycan biosynthesis protein MviN/MurJ (putative lipid II flippase)